MNKIIIICGATASGKTATGIEVAKLVNGEIISADSMQIYRDMNIGTAKVTLDEMDGIAHHLVDIINPSDSFSVSQYSELTHNTIEKIIQRGKTPIIVGGTGLYIDGIIYPFSFGIKCDNPDIRTQLLTEYEIDNGINLYKQLCEIDYDDASKFHPNNKHRLVRALEIYRTTGKTKSQLSVRKNLIYDVDMRIIDIERVQLYERINKRVDIMVANGITEEIKHLLDQGITFDMQSMKAIGYKEFEPFFNGTSNIDDVINTIKLNTRHYAKRQITWFKKYDFAKWASCKEIIDSFR